jgi:cysteine desulfurase
MIYLDNNATTTMPKCVMKAMLSWCNMGNPSASYATAKESRGMMDNFRNYIGAVCEVDTCCPEERDEDMTADDNGVNGTKNNRVAKCDPNKYKVVFTSGASEANSTIISGVVAAYAHARGVIPNIVISAIEHKGLIATAKALEARGAVTITFVQPTYSGHILARDVARAITRNTCLVCVMHANNETGAINDIAAIGKVAHDLGVPLHCDTVQTFGKFPLNPIKAGIDSFCVSFHKFRGPPGTGVLVVRQKFLLGYKIPPLIFGSQNEGYRGGTENLPGIGASYEALRYNFKDRAEKNRKMSALKTLLLCELSKKFSVRPYEDYVVNNSNNPLEIVVFSMCSIGKVGSVGGESIRNDGVRYSTPLLSDEDYVYSRDELYLCNTVLLSVVKKRGEYICNGKLKSFLEARGIVVSVGSACNTASPKASHVLYSMGADKYIRKGTLRISMGDDNTWDDVMNFVREFKNAIDDQCNV